MSKTQNNSGLTATDTPELWQPPEQPEQPPKPPLQRKEVETTLTKQVGRWLGRKRAYSADEAERLLRILSNQGYETGCLMPARTTYQLLSDQAELAAGLVRRIQ